MNELTTSTIQEYQSINFSPISRRSSSPGLFLPLLSLKDECDSTKESGIFSKGSCDCFWKFHILFFPYSDDKPPFDWSVQLASSSAFLCFLI